MNIIRLIKLKKINGDLDDLTKQELFFVSILNDSVITSGKVQNLNFLNCTYSESKHYYKDNINYLRIYTLHSGEYVIWLSDDFFDAYRKKFRIGEKKIKELVKGFMIMRLGLSKIEIESI